MKILHPPEWPKPKGYSNGVEASGRIIFISGQIGWDSAGRLVGDSIVDQTDQALKNITTILGEAAAKPEHITRLTWYVIDKRSYLQNAPAIGTVYRSNFGSHYPAMSLVEVSGLLEDGALIEIEATAVAPL